MRRRTRTTITLTALAATSTLLLAGCGGGGDDGGEDKKNGDNIEGAGSAKDKSKPSPSPSEAGDFKRPPIKLPSDVHLVFDFDKPSDPDEAAAQGDAANFVRALKQGITQRTVKTKPLGFYTVPLKGAQQYAIEQVDRHVKAGMSIVGTERFYRNRVRMSENGRYATVAFCSEQTKFFGKNVKSGKTVRGEGDDLNNYLSFSIDMQKAPAPKGLWQAHSIQVKEKVRECKSQ